MIIVWVYKHNWMTLGPIVNIAVHNAASFSDIGYETHLFIGEGTPSDTETDLAGVYGLRPRTNFTVHRIPRYRVGNSTYSASIFFHAYRYIKKLSKTDKVTVFTRESSFLVLLSRLCRKNNRVQGFYELHNLYADISWETDKKSEHYREKIKEHLLLPKISGLVCITREQEKRYNHLFPEIPSCAIPLGTKPVADPYTAEEKRTRRTLMYVGQLHGEKGVDFLLQAAHRLKHHNVRVLFWGGKTWEAASFEKKASDMGISDHVRFVPFQPLDQMHEAMAKEASLGAVMLKDTYYNRYLTCPVKALDYLSHGIPAIGSRLPAVQEVLDSAGTYVPPDNLDAFTAAVLSLLDDPAQYALMCQFSRQRAEKISWQNRARALAAFAQGLQ